MGKHGQYIEHASEEEKNKQAWSLDVITRRGASTWHEYMFIKEYEHSSKHHITRSWQVSMSYMMCNQFIEEPTWERWRKAWHERKWHRKYAWNTVNVIVYSWKVLMKCMSKKDKEECIIMKMSLDKWSNMHVAYNHERHEWHVHET